MPFVFNIVSDIKYTLCLRNDKHVEESSGKYELASLSKCRPYASGITYLKEKECIQQNHL